MVSLSEIPGIKNYINTKISEGVFNKTGELNQAVFDTDNILEVIDTLNNANYSFRFTLPNSSIGKFYNLVVGQTPTGELITPFVLKYECDASHIDQYIANDFDFSFFKGTIALHKYTDFFGEGYFSKVDETVVCPPEYDDVGDPIPCDTTPINGGGSGGGGSTGDGSGDTGSTGSTGGSVGGTGGSNISITYEDCECHTVHASGGCTHPILTITIGINRSLNKASNKGEDCPDCTPDNDGGIAINTLTFADMSTTLKHNLTLSSNAISFIGNSDNIKEVTGAYFYLQVHQDDFNGGYMAEAKSFAKLAIEALASNDY
ncbi:MAG: hypothetical protein KAJ28_11870, partial [Flavobacteriaceae bacterium]|nr:hypothetical protein [Flavobacteriaceae bacterium]